MLDSYVAFSMSFSKPQLSTIVGKALCLDDKGPHMKQRIIFLLLFMFIAISLLCACAPKSNFTYSEGDYSGHTCEYWSGCSNKPTIMIGSKEFSYKWYYCSEHSDFAQSLYAELVKDENTSSSKSGAPVAGGIVLILTLIYVFILAMHTKSIVELLLRATIFFIIALFVVSLLGTMLMTGHFAFGLIMLGLIFVIVASIL